MESHKRKTGMDEIDLGRVFTGLITLIKKYLVLIIICIGIGLTIGLSLFYSANPFFKSQMIADSNTLPNTEVINIVEYWQNLIDKGDYEVLADKLNVERKVLKNLTKIEAKNTTTALQTTESTGEGSFTISVQVLSPRILDSLEFAVVNALQNNEYARKRGAIRKENLRLLKEKVIDEITALDSVKNSVKDLLKGGSGSSSAFLTDPSSVNLQIITLYEKALDLDASIRLSDEIQIIQGFTKSNKPDGPKILPYLVFGILIGAILAFILILILFFTGKRKDPIGQVY